MPCVAAARSDSGMASYASAATEDADSALPGEPLSAGCDAAENGEEVVVPNLFIQFCLREVGLFLIIVQFLSVDMAGRLVYTSKCLQRIIEDPQNDFF